MVFSSPSIISPACHFGFLMRFVGWRAAAVFAVRQLYMDDEEVLFQAARPILLNGIEDVISRPDLADRAIFLSLPAIDQVQRRAEAELWSEFEIARPRILGALLNAAAHGLRSLSDLGRRLQPLPRMADFTLWATTCETALWSAGTFAQAYEANCRAAIESMIDGDGELRPRDHRPAENLDRDRC
jgi:hypothetical protein